METPRSCETSLTEAPDGTLMTWPGIGGDHLLFVARLARAAVAAVARALLGAAAAPRGAGVDDDAAPLAARAGRRRPGAPRRLAAGAVAYAFSIASSSTLTWPSTHLDARPS